MNKGDIVLIAFPFTDLTGSKRRPSVVLATSMLDCMVCFITTQLSGLENTDIILSPNLENGLKKRSLLKPTKIATLDKTLVKGRMGRLNAKELVELNTMLKIVLGLF